MFCAQCGHRLNDGAKFCSNCGTVAAVIPPPPPSVTPPAAAQSTPLPTTSASASPPLPAHAPAASTPASSGAGVGDIGRGAGARPEVAAARPEPRPYVGSPALAGSSTGFSGDAAAAGASDRFDAGALARGLVARVKAIILTPSTEWPVIADEPSSARDIYLRYVAPLAAIGVIATFIGSTLIGVHVPLLGNVRVPIIAGIGGALFAYLFAFVGVFVISWLVDVLAPTFGGTRDPLRALKVTAYSYTPAWIAGVLHIIPFAGIGVLAAIAGLYGLYLLYLGLPVLMRSPQDKAIGYTVVLVLCAIVTSVVIGLLSTCAVAGLGMAGMGAMGALAPKIDKSAATTETADTLSNIFGGKTDADRARVKDALSQLTKMGEQAEQAEKTAKVSTSPVTPGASANAIDMNTAMNAVGQIMAGGKNIQPVDFRKLKDMLPESLEGLKRTEASGQSGEAMGMKGSSATASYSDGANANLHVEIADMGSLSGLASLAAKFDPKVERETENGYERTSTVNGQIVHERYDRRAKSGEVSVIVGSRFAVTVGGSGVEARTLLAAVKDLDIGKLASLTPK